MEKFFDRVNFVIASGALGFDGKGYWWEKILIWLGLIKPEIFDLVITKTLTFPPYEGNLKWWKLWECFRLIPGGSVNKVGLTNRGIHWWLEKVAPQIDFKKINLAVSIYGTKYELLEMVKILNDCGFEIKAIEINFSCPNTDHLMEEAETVIDTVKSIKDISHYPIIVKVSVSQDYLAIASGLKDIAEAISLNSVPWETAFPNIKSPLWKLEKKVGGGGGGVSGEHAQIFNWPAAEDLVKQNSLPVIFPDIMGDGDIKKVIHLGARQAISFGIVCTLKPWWPTKFVTKFKLENK